MKKSTVKLGVNIDHVATLRQARGGRSPCPSLAAREAERGGADGITAHLREDRRHIQDRDLPAIRKKTRLPLNLEMSLEPGIVAAALSLVPEKVCIVPERRAELTTEGGLDALANERKLRGVVAKLRKKGIEVSLFIEASPEQIKAAFRVMADAVEIHTGRYAGSGGAARRRELRRIRSMAALAVRLGLKVNAGHGLDYENVSAVARIPGLNELNIGHAIVSRAVFTGMRRAVREMKQLLRRPR